MIDLDALADEEAAKNARPCWVCVLPDRERLWVAEALKAGRSMSIIAKVLVKAGHAGASEHRIKSHKYKHAK